MFLLAEVELLAGLLLKAGELVAVFGGHLAEDLAGPGVFDVAERLGRGLAEDLADLQPAVGPHDNLIVAAIFPAAGGRKHPQQPHRAVANHVVSHDRRSPIPLERRVATFSPLPLGEGQGVRVVQLGLRKTKWAAAPCPHPLPLPKGEGTDLQTHLTVYRRPAAAQRAGFSRGANGQNPGGRRRLSRKRSLPFRTSLPTTSSVPFCWAHFEPSRFFDRWLAT